MYEKPKKEYIYIYIYIYVGGGGDWAQMPKQAHLIETQNRACGLSGQLVVIHMEGVDPGPYNRRHNPKVEMTNK